MCNGNNNSGSYDNKQAYVRVHAEQCKIKLTLCFWRDKQLETKKVNNMRFVCDCLFFKGKIHFKAVL